MLLGKVYFGSESREGAGHGAKWRGITLDRVSEFSAQLAHENRTCFISVGLRRLGILDAE